MNHFKSKETYRQFYEEQSLNHGNDHLTGDYIRIQFALDNIKSSDKVLEVGCQSGGITRFMAEKAEKVVAVEVAGGYLNKAKIFCKAAGVIDNIEFYNAFGEDFLKDTKQKFNVIVIMEVLEHVMEPEKLIELCKNRLAKKGKLLITVPDETYVDVIGEHKTVLNENKLKEMLSGFEKVKIYHDVMWYFGVAVR